MNIISRFKTLSLKQKLATLLVIAVILWFSYTKLTGSKGGKVSYQTTTAETGVLVQSVTASGRVSSANNTSVSTQASGVVSKVFVKNDQVVKAGDKIAELDLDLDGQYRAAQALSSYQSAKSNLDSAKASLFSANSTMWSVNQKFINDAVARNLTTDNPAYIQQNSDWLAAEAKYRIQQNAISQAQTAVGTAWLNYQSSSPIIYAPISGTITGLSLQPGTVLIAQSNSSGSAASQKIASVKTNAAAQIQVNITESDITKITIGAQATITLDAFPDTTFTGSVISVDTIGSISSNVTSYPAIIGLDIQDPRILPNMAATAKIITKVLPQAVLIPSSAVQTTNGQSTVRILKNGQPQTVDVTTVGASDSQVAISSGVGAGDVVVTSVVNSTTTRSTTTGSSSVFGGFGGGAARVQFGR
jgi:RND family efflux transporter MFP subunit